jgi:hypothetical protein
MNGTAARAKHRRRKASRLEARWRDRRLRLRALHQRLGECRRELREALARTAPDPIEVGELALEERLLLEQEHELVARRALARAHAGRANGTTRAGDVSAAA